jgi:single-strand DNA-binding protein
MGSVNKVTLLGNIGREPEARTTQSGSTVVTLSIATADSYKDKSGNWQEKTEWHKVKLWDKLAERASQYLKKGSKVYIEGKLKYGSYEKDGQTVYTTDIVGYQMILLDKKESGTQQKPVSKPQQQEGFDEDVPF